MRVEIVPEPSESERDAILAALTDERAEHGGGWAEAALAEGVEEAALEP